MKKQLLIVAGVVGVAVVAVFAQTAAVSVWEDYRGLHIGAKATDKVAFRDATPIAKQIITNIAPVQIQVLAIDGSTNTIAAFVTTNQLNQIRNCLVNHGLASTTGN